MTEELAQLMRRELEEHYKEPVRPVSEYCNAFREWHKALGEKCKREEHDDYRDESLIKAYEALNALALPIYKSAMLGRMIYGGEQARIEMCPKHKGRWVGLPWGDNDCEHGCQLTGWLPND